MVLNRSNFESLKFNDLFLCNGFLFYSQLDIKDTIHIRKNMCPFLSSGYLNLTSQVTIIGSLANI